MKKNLFNLMSIAMIALASVCFVSCGDDGGNGNNSSNRHGISSSLVGVWAQEHTTSILRYYLGFKLDANGNVSYFEWNYNEEPDWNYDTGGRWTVTDNVFSVYEPDGSLAFSSQFSLSEDKNSITFIGKSSGTYNLTGTYVRYNK